MIEFRWVILLALWTLLIGPVMDLTQNAPTATQERGKTTQASKGPTRR